MIHIKKCGFKILVLCLAVTLAIAGALPTFAEEETKVNRFNVMIVVDASGSMTNTDPNGLRFEAISQFTNLLAAEGNYLGGIVFSTDISAKQEPVPVSSQESKDSVTELLKSVPAVGWTNTGEALACAVDLLNANGDPSLPSVVVLLSDGNTDMGDKDKTEESLNKKADAIQTARESDVAIYTVCLNANDSADVSEMEQISDATGGVFREVGKAEDLQEVFNTFYNLIYGTSTVMLVDEVFPEEGFAENKFEVPGIGVEEVNIIIYGKTAEVVLTRPDGKLSSASPVVYDSFTMIKVTDVLPGSWTIMTKGVPGDSIKINMVYNTNLGVELVTNTEQNFSYTETPIKLTATLKAGSSYADDESQYTGYSATLHIYDAYGDEIKTEEMGLTDGHFETEELFEEGVYNFMVTVNGNHLSKESATVGPITVVEKVVVENSTDDTASEEEPEVIIPVNTPPVPKQEKVTKTVYVWPFFGGKTEFDLNILAEDAEDETLRYKIVSSSFVEDKDYRTDENGVVTVDNFSLSKGAFTVRATDSGGLSCDIEVIIKTHNVGIIALIVIGIGALLVIAALAFITYKSLGKPFMGTVTVENTATGESASVRKSRGRLKLKTMQIGQCGIDGNAYFQATGKNFIYLKSSKPLCTEGSLKKLKKIKIESGLDTRISTDDRFETGILVRFDSMLNNMY